MKIVDYSEIRKLFNEEYIRTMQLVRDGETHLDNLAEGFLEADRVIARLPEVDAVPVVRCKDCKHWSIDCGIDETVCLKIYSDGAASAYAWQARKPDDFCSYGERRTDNDA